MVIEPEGGDQQSGRAVELDHRLHGAIVRQVRQAARRVPGQDGVDVDADVAGAGIPPVPVGVELDGEELAGAVGRGLVGADETEVPPVTTRERTISTR